MYVPVLVAPLVVPYNPRLLVRALRAKSLLYSLMTIRTALSMLHRFGPISLEPDRFRNLEELVRRVLAFEHLCQRPN